MQREARLKLAGALGITPHHQLKLVADLGKKSAEADFAHRPPLQTAEAVGRPPHNKVSPRLRLGQMRDRIANRRSNTEGLSPPVSNSGRICMTTQGTKPANSGVRRAKGWTIADVIDFEYLLADETASADEPASRRTRELFQAKILPALRDAGTGSRREPATLNRTRRLCTPTAVKWNFA